MSVTDATACADGTTVEPEPLARWLRQQVRVCGSYSAFASAHGISGGDVYYAMTSGAPVPLALVDRIFTRGGDPGALARLYPVEVGSLYDRYCPTCSEVVTVDDWARCPWCDMATKPVR